MLNWKSLFFSTPFVFQEKKLRLGKIKLLSPDNLMNECLGCLRTQLVLLYHGRNQGKEIWPDCSSLSVQGNLMIAFSTASERKLARGTHLSILFLSYQIPLVCLLSAVSCLGSLDCPLLLTRLKCLKRFGIYLIKC